MSKVCECNKCNTEVVFGDIVVEGYLCFCPLCEEDLEYSEVIYKGFNAQHLKSKANLKGISTVMLEDGSYVGVHNRVISAVNFDNPIQAMNMHWIP